MQRCVSTGQAIAQATGAPLRILDDLNDLDYGAWQWRTYAEIKAQAPELFARWFAAPHLVRFPDGDSLQDLVSRAADALRCALSRHPDDVIVMVGHDSVNRALLLQLLDQPLAAYWRLAQDPCAISEIDIVESRSFVRRINAADHLDEKS